jgi:hypothetical protein
LLEGGEVGRGVVGTESALIAAENHVHDPMEAVLDRLVATDRWPHQVRRRAALQRPKAAQQPELGAPEQGDVEDGLGAG